MKKITLFITALVLSAISINVKAQEVQSVEGGVYIGPTIPLGGYHHLSNRVFVGFGGSVSYNLKTLPVDCGLFMQLDCADHGLDRADMTTLTQNNRTLTLGLVGNYNFNRCSKVNPFAGLGLGVGFNDVVGTVIYRSKSTSLVVMPRVGVELWHHLRLTAYATICRAGYNCAGLTVGVSFGGRPKKIN